MREAPLAQALKEFGRWQAARKARRMPQPRPRREFSVTVSVAEAAVAAASDLNDRLVVVMNAIEDGDLKVALNAAKYCAYIVAELNAFAESRGCVAATCTLERLLEK